ncbi:MAG: ABC transporter permease [Oscillospiraceae bacterium]|nr:ABC transporter permease [Oscillospiraceae bacterium]
MKNQFFAVFKHEFKTTAKSGAFVATTVIFALLIFAGIGFPLFLQADTDEPRSSSSFLNVEELLTSNMSFAEKKIILGASEDAEIDLESMAGYLQENLGYYDDEEDYDSRPETAVFTGSAEDMEAEIAAQNADYGLFFTDPLSYTIYLQELGIMDMNSYSIDEQVLAKYRTEALTRLGAGEDEINQILNAYTAVDTVATRNDGVASQGYTYVLMMLLYMTILLYGSIVSSSVAAEKSSRAMELLVTAAKPSALMFGKVLGVGFAGLCQMLAWMFTAFGAYALSGNYWSENSMISGLFGGENTSLLIYTVVFFILGYLLYSFLFGAMGSLVSRTEDLQSTLMPVTLLVVIAFMVSYFSTIMGYVDSLLMRVFSFVPFTSPLAMFIRIINNNAENWEVVLSIVLLIVGCVLVGILATAIYRIGVLLYGKPPKVRELLKLLRG